MLNVSADMKKLLLLKEKISFFNGLRDDDIVSLVDEVKILEFAKGDFIIQEGAKYNKYIYVLLQGRVEVKKVAGSKDIHIADMKDEGTFGEISALTGHARSASIIASKSGTMLIAFSIKYDLDSGKALFYKNVIDELSNKIIAMNKTTQDEVSMWD